MRMFRWTALLSAGLTLTTAAHAQDAGEDAPPPAFPETEIFLFDYDAAASDEALSNPKNVTQRTGYDNQPYFTKDGATFLYSRDDGTQTDIWEYDIASGTHTRITNTPENEFSPTPSPDNQTITMVFERNRSIWVLDRANPDEPKWLMAASGNDEPVGYFARDHDLGTVFYWSRYGFSVAVDHQRGSEYHFISGHAVPSTPHLVPRSTHFSFVHRQTNGQVWIKEFDPANKSVRPLIQTVGSNANYTWAPDDTILQIEDDKLYRWKKDSDEGWKVIADLSEHGIESANRIAVSPDGKRIAVVGLKVE